MTGLADLVPAVARRTGLEPEDVESILRLHGVPEHFRATPKRHLRLNRLRIRGTKNIEGHSAGFDRAFTLAPGLTVITGGNLRGKTTLLEIVTLLLRGSARSLQPDVRQWLTHAGLDVEVNGVPLGLRVRLVEGKIVHGVVLSGSTDELAGADDDNGSCDVVDAASDDADWQRAVEALLLDRLGLEPLPSYARVAGREIGTVQSHGWPAYFSVLYPPVGADRVLLGDDTGTGLGTRLLDVFLDLPGAALRARLAAAHGMLKAQSDAKRAQSDATAKALAERVGHARVELERARAALTVLQAQERAGDVDAARDALSAARTAQDEALAREGELSAELSQARRARIDDQRALNALVENAVAGALLHGLNPAACPRCENSIDDERRRGETLHHTCAVCARPVPDDDHAADLAERKADAETSLRASESGERLLEAALEAASGRTAAASDAVTTTRQALDRAESGQDAAALAQAEREVAVAETSLSVLESLDPPREAPDAALTVLKAAQDELTSGLTETSKELLDGLNKDIAELARGFGMTNLESVSLKRNLHMPVVKGGGASAAFGQQSAGERLRLRYALLIALLRIGHRRSIASHPGLLLLDSIKAEEVQDDDAAQLLAALGNICREEPALQILVTTEDASLPAKLSPPPATITPPEGHGALF